MAGLVAWAYGCLGAAFLLSPPARAAAQTAAPSPVFDVPRLDKIAVDGKPDDWGERGFKVEVLAPLEGAPRPPSDLGGAFRLGWDARGLLVLAMVRDDVASEERVNTAL